MNRTDALKLLGLCDSATHADITAAFRARIKGVHPDLNRADLNPTSDALLRLMILARDALINDNNRPSQDTDIKQDICHLEITPQQALHGGDVVRDVNVNLDVIENDHTVQSLNHHKRIRITLPKGLRAGEILRLKNGQLSPHTSRVSGALLFRIAISLSKDMTVAGNDIWITAAIDAKILHFGGMADIDTPHGTHNIGISGPVAINSSLRLEGLGLPARAGFAAGDLYVRLQAAATPLRPAADLLVSFTRRWG